MNNNEGQTFYYLTILKYQYTKNRHKYYLCKCKCGNEKIINIDNLKSGKTKSCGCYNKKLLQQRRKKCNEYEFNNEYVIGITSNTKEKFYFDLEDFDKIKDYCWYKDRFGYVVNIKDRKNIKLHKLITNTNEDTIVDHINRNKLDNRKCNLRICTKQQNNFNTNISKNNTSGYKGVYWDKSRGKWSASIGYNYKTIFLGRYNTKEEAYKKRLEAEEKYYKEFMAKNI